MIHVVGGGVAGLVAAHALLKAGRPVTLHEGSPGAGGRARALPDGTDNGTHALIGANRAALRFLHEIGARESWIEPEPDGLPVLDRADGSRRLVSLSPFGWWRRDRRPAGVSAWAVATMMAMALPGRDRTVAAAMARHPDFLRGFVDPLTVAALNTPVGEAGTRRLAQVLRRLGTPGATRLLVARRGLGPDLVEPALAAIRRLGGMVVTEDRLRKLDRAGGRVTSLHLHSGTVALGAEDKVVLSVPPWEAVRLLTHVPVPERHAPIVNLHFAHTGPGPVRFVGMVGALCQWVLVRPEGVSVTVSAGDAEAREEVDTLAPRAWAEIREAAAAFALPGEWPEETPPCRVVKERRATPRHGPGAIPKPPRRPLANLVLAGDWTWPGLPATIEAATLSGLAAAEALR
ncbi:hydroxysqualene dehydroxylase [Sabulicella glaciei]|uniref:FAD-dependent oxidoreductase n=1 Tax=Sabulicella glaciei TaxID=2984948 RepID=A0ABT3NWA2_9PROT|nr:FAD-dependent oxidoreductase [Roseococcus sp. MDT2-1-1]MCW8085869.1 FAD-dependent oxidoreductase [Roseococcus sp. MDT2-1-1]